MPSPHYAVGRYACRVTEQALGEAKTGNPQFVLRFTVLGAVDSKDPSRYLDSGQQYERTMYRAITEKTIPYLMEDLNTLGFAGSSFAELDPKTPNFHNFHGMDFDGWCAHEAGQNGELREKWGVAKQSTPLEVKPVEPKKLRELDALFGKHLKALKKTDGPAATPRPTPINAPSMGVDDSDIPF